MRQGRRRAPTNVRYPGMERAAFVVYCLLFVALFLGIMWFLTGIWVEP